MSYRDIDLVELTGQCIENEMASSPIMVFDWDKAARLIIENDIRCAEAYLDGDYENTCGLILEDGHLVGDHGAVLESYNHIPLLYDRVRDVVYPCFKKRGCTNWTPSAVMKLTGGKVKVDEGGD